MHRSVLGTVLYALLTASRTVEAHGPRVGWVKPATPEGVTAYDVQYELDGQSYTGYVAYPDDSIVEPFEPMAEVPGVLIAHQWYGLGEFGGSNNTSLMSAALPCAQPFCLTTLPMTTTHCPRRRHGEIPRRGDGLHHELCGVCVRCLRDWREGGE